MNARRILALLCVTAMLAACNGDEQGSGASSSGPFEAEDEVGDFDGKCGGDANPAAGTPPLDLTGMYVSFDGDTIVLIATFAGDARDLFGSGIDGVGMDVIVNFGGNFVNVLIDTDGTSKVADGKAQHELSWTASDTLRVELTDYPDGDIVVARVATSSFAGDDTFCDIVEAAP